MRTWFRELFGLLLVFIGLFVWANCMNFLYDLRIIEGSILFFMGFAVFKAGIHLVKVALAARILLDEKSEEAAGANGAFGQPAPRPKR